MLFVPSPGDLLTFVPMPERTTEKIEELILKIAPR